jgi:ABC-type multidrug transport system, ATPase component
MKEALQIEGLTVAYPQGFKKYKLAIDDISFDIEQGKILGLLGPNGAGKTTLMKTIIGLISAKKGRVSIFGQPVSTKTLARVGYMPEISNFYWFLTPKETLEMFGRLSGMSRSDIVPRIGSVLGMVGLSGEKDQLVKSFSKGMAERLNMAQAIMHDPQILILDEPFSGMDPIGRIHMRNILSELKREGKTILLSSHELSEAELISDDICIMKKGRILKHAPLADILKERADRSLEKYFLHMMGEENG